MANYTDRVFEPGADCPADDYYAITPSDSTNFAAPFRAIYVGTGGNIVIVSGAGNAVTFKNAVAGTTISAAGVRVNAANTTATDLVGLI